MIVEFQGIKPIIHDSAYLADSAEIIGKVKIGKFSSVWPKAILRGDLDEIVVGMYSNIQDNCVIHADLNRPTVIGDYVTVGHGAILHGCQIGNNCLIGMGAIVLDRAKIGADCLVAAGALIPEDKVIPAGSLVLGVPGKVVRKLNQEEIEVIRKSAEEYAGLSREYKKP